MGSPGVLVASGYTLLYLGWGIGIPLIVYGLKVSWPVRGRESLVRRGKLPPGERRGPNARGPSLAVWFLAWATMATLGLPWLRGVGVDGDLIEISGWFGVDLASVAFIIAGGMALMIFASVTSLTERYHDLVEHAADLRSRLRTVDAALSMCVLAVIAGNVMIQAAMPEGSRVAWGAWVNLAVALAAAATCVWQWFAASRATAVPLGSAP